MNRMMLKSTVFVLIVLAMLSSPAQASALTGCGTAYYVQWGDSLSGIAQACGTTMYAIQLANPGLGSWVYAGQVLTMPGTGGSVSSTGYTWYTVQWGDTLRILANRYGTTVDAIASLNGIAYYDYIYTGQSLKIPGAGYTAPVYSTVSSGSAYVVQYGDTVKKLAYRWGVAIGDILAANPQIVNMNYIYAGQIIYQPFGTGGPVYPASASYYTVQYGDTLRIIANRYGSTVYTLQTLNPQIWNPNYIYAGTVIRVQ